MANITARDADVSYEALQKAVDNLARMYNDSLNLSNRAGGGEPCPLPLKADLQDFDVHNTDSSLSSFQSSIVDSFQSSLLITPSRLALSPLTADTVPIIPRPLRAPKSSTPTITTPPATSSAQSSPSLPSSSTITMETLPALTLQNADAKVSFNGLDLLHFPTAKLMCSQSSVVDMDISPRVTASDLSFVEAVTNPPALAPLTTSPSRPSPNPTLPTSPSDTLTYTAISASAVPDYETRANYITYETLSEMYGDAVYNGSSEEDDYFHL